MYAACANDRKGVECMIFSALEIYLKYAFYSKYDCYIGVYP